MKRIVYNLKDDHSSEHKPIKNIVVYEITSEDDIKNYLWNYERPITKNVLFGLQCEDKNGNRFWRTDHLSGRERMIVLTILMQREEISWLMALSEFIELRYNSMMDCLKRDGIFYINKVGGLQIKEFFNIHKDNIEIIKEKEVKVGDKFRFFEDGKRCKNLILENDEEVDDLIMTYLVDFDGDVKILNNLATIDKQILIDNLNHSERILFKSNFVNEHQFKTYLETFKLLKDKMIYIFMDLEFNGNFLKLCKKYKAGVKKIIDNKNDVYYYTNYKSFGNRMKNLDKVNLDEL